LHLITLSDNHIHTHTHTLGRIPLDKGSARCRDLYLTTHNTHKTFMSPAGFEPAIPASELSQIHALHRAATGIGDVLSSDSNPLNDYPITNRK